VNDFSDITIGNMADRFTAEEIKQFSDAFVIFDKDGSGAIDVHEFRLVAAEFGIESTLEETMALVKTFDNDGSGQIEFNEFLMIMAKKLHRLDDDDDSSDWSDDGDDAAPAVAASPTAAKESGDHPSSPVDRGGRGPQYAAMTRPELAQRLSFLHAAGYELMEALTNARQEEGAEGADVSDHQVAFDEDAAEGHSATLDGVGSQVFLSLRQVRRGLPIAMTNVAADRPDDLRQYVKDCVAAVELKLASMIEFEEVAMEGRVTVGGRGAKQRLAADPAVLSVQGKTLVSRTDTSLDGDAVQSALDKLAGYTFDDAPLLATERPSKHQLEGVRNNEASLLLQGSAAFRYFVRYKLHYNVGTVEPICDQLDMCDEMASCYTDTAGKNEFLLKPQCADGRNCKIRHNLAHKAQFTHPCYCEVPQAGESGESAIVGHCVHMQHRAHMQCYRHGATDSHKSAESRMQEISKRMGLVDVSGCESADRGAQALAFVLQKDAARAKHAGTARAYTSLVMPHNQITPVGGIPLMEACTELVVLDLACNSLGSRSSLLAGHGVGGAIYHLLTRSERLTTLDLSSNDLSDSDGRFIADGIRSNAVLRRINLRNNGFGPAFGEEMAGAIADNRELKEIFLGYNRLEAAGTKKLAEELSQVSTLEVIDLSWTGLKDSATEHLGLMIEGNMVLTSLVLSHNSISSKGAGVLSKAVLTNKTLLRLDLSFNPLGDAGVLELMRDLVDNTTLVFLDLRCVKADEAVSKQINLTMSERLKKDGSIHNQQILFCSTVHTMGAHEGLLPLLLKAA
jgi:hypothetical protein